MIISAIKNWPRFFPLLIVALIVAAFYWSSRSERAVESSADMEIPVRIAQVKRISLPRTVRLTGELAPVTQRDVVSRLAGKVAEMRFKVGDFVIAGTIVATIRASDLDQRLGGLHVAVSAAKQELREREDGLVAAEKHLADNRELLGRDLIARRDVEQSEIDAKTVRAQAELARAHLAQQEAMLAQVRALQNLTRLAAPISGEIGSLSTKPGAVVAEGGAILSIVSLDTLKLVANVNAASLVRRGMKASASPSDHPGVVSRGEVVRFDAEKHSEGESEAEIHLDNPKRILRPGMTVQVSIDLEAEEEVILVPRAAVFAENKRDYVYKLSQAQAIRHPVVLGALKGDDIAVARGLSVGDTIIVDAKMIKSGMRVRPVSTPPNPAENER